MSQKHTGYISEAYAQDLPYFNNDETKILRLIKSPGNSDYRGEQDGILWLILQIGEFFYAYPEQNYSEFAGLFSIRQEMATGSLADFLTMVREW